MVYRGQTAEAMSRGRENTERSKMIEKQVNFLDGHQSGVFELTQAVQIRLTTS